MFSTRFQRPVIICAVLVLETAVVVKTVMHEFTLED